MVNNTIYQFLDSNLGVEIYLKRREHQKKGALKIEASQYILYWGFKKMLFKLYIYVLGKILQNGAKFIQKLTPDFKDHMRKLENLKKNSGKSKKLKFDGLLLSKKYILSAKIVYTESLSNFSCHFWRHTLFFATHFCIF